MNTGNIVCCIRQGKSQSGSWKATGVMALDNGHSSYLHLHPESDSTRTCLPPTQSEILQRFSSLENFFKYMYKLYKCICIKLNQFPLLRIKKKNNKNSPAFSLSGIVEMLWKKKKTLNWVKILRIEQEIKNNFISMKNHLFLIYTINKYVFC